MSSSGIDESLRALAADDAGTVVPPHVEAAVMRAWDAREPIHAEHVVSGVSRTRAPWAWVPVAVAAAAIVMAAVLVRDRTVESPDAPGLATGRHVPGAAPTDAGYVLVADPFADTAALNLVRVRMSRRALASLGLPIVNPDADGLVDVEMIVGEDGVARSIRRAVLVGTD